MEKYVYVIISRTPTSTGKIVRKFLKEKYNHASISLDKNLSQMYSFCRFSVSNPLVGGIVRESAFTLTIGLKENVPIKIYRIPVTAEKYELISKFIYGVYNDTEIYYYNFLQAIGLINNKRHAIYKTYICTEFVMEALRQAGISLTTLEPYQITPTDICRIMGEFICYSGNLDDYPFRIQIKTKNDERFFCKTGFFYEGLHTIKHFWMVVSRDRNSKRVSKSKRSRI
ncbi:hypothetical protein [Clostridium estertheticum]|uniref:Uncharacterized protein n=1 Tax=Clostridium estertheticum subsp. estertheticum TaxID=1552 RepID=A0A1J0GE42_9CLOT|nr:hypothetical protein [Clostridium estertheticum]APC39567.1 hypothetical protein A7L45_05540 [Clostridium estertheticum subsp. estertheticum]MBU3170772.1 hypothetical protein [Clostridium estertheticum]MBU3184597.1 hypothetical protein [Clostridium estertheticum]MBZ9614403.1 hypothetical protein [Clostridium estertheticum subsp. laramiense]WAG74335.1 hypothetical protein LL032_02450 [Clostridium estertheticum]